jgi:hypothetical protein
MFDHDWVLFVDNLANTRVQVELRLWLAQARAGEGKLPADRSKEQRTFKFSDSSGGEDLLRLLRRRGPTPQEERTSSDSSGERDLLRRERGAVCSLISH